MQQGSRARIKKRATVWRASDEPKNTIGSLAVGTIVRIGVGPHMGKRSVTVLEGSGPNGWVSNSALEAIADG